MGPAAPPAHLLLLPVLPVLSYSCDSRVQLDLQAVAGSQGFQAGCDSREASAAGAGGAPEQRQNRQAKPSRAPFYPKSKRYDRASEASQIQPCTEAGSRELGL